MAKWNGKVVDTMLAHHLRWPDLPHDLEFIGSMFCSKPAWKHEKASLELYNARDVDVTMQAYLQLKPLLQQANLQDIHDYISVPMGKICGLMHKTGFKVDPAHIGEVREKIAKQMAESSQLLPEHLRTRTATVTKTVKVPEGYIDEKGKKRKTKKVEVEEVVHPWRQASAVEKWLYHDLGLPIQRDIKTNNVTTGKVALEKLSRDLQKQAAATKDEAKAKQLAAQAKAVNALRTLRKLNSLNTLFCKEEMLDVKRMHPHFNVHGTASGRLSSSEPNLQNVPEAARFIYVPSTPGWKIIDVDYSQIENRLTAHFAGDTERLQRFVDDPGFSEHKYLASIFLKVPYDEVEKSSDPEGPYIRAKKIVHGTNYGEGALKISRLNNLPFKDVKDLQTLWKQAIHKTIQWQETCAGLAKKQGYLANPFGRKRWFWTSSSYTESLSFLPQSTGADILFRAMLALMYERIGWPLDKVLRVVDIVEPLPQPATLLISVHDSLVFEAPAELVPEVVRVLRRVLQQPWKELGGFTIPVSVKVGCSWGECEAYDLS